MTEARFPKRRDDGSFTLVARFAASETDMSVVDLVRDYVSAWTRANRAWVRIWRSDVIQEERLEFLAEFSSDPRVEVGDDGHRLSIVLEGRPSAGRWKDWAVFLVDELSRVFPEIKFERFES